MSRKMLHHNNLLWINIEQPTTDDINYLKEQYAFHPLALEDCLSQLERPKIDEYADHLFIVLHFPIFNRERRLNRPGEVDIFIGQDYLVTVHDGTLHPLSKFYAKCLQSVQVRDRYMRHNPSILLHAIVDRLVDYLFPLLHKINQRITQIEEDIFNEDAKEVVQEISLVRREIISMRRIVRPQVSIVASLETKERRFISTTLDDYFGDVYDHIEQVKDILDEDYEIIADLSEATDSLISYRINEVMRTLTVISVIMLPLTLVSGIYGMNVELPFNRSPYAFYILSGMMVMILTVMLLFFRYRRWL